MTQFKTLFKRRFLNVLGRKKLLFWLAENANSDETCLYNHAAKTYKSLGDREWQALILTNFTKRNIPLSIPFYTNFIANGNQFYSQLSQDCFIDTLLHQKENGIFVEIGVGNGKDLSNTYFFEKNRNWKGVLCEPAKQFHESISKNRSAIHVDQAIYHTGGLRLRFSELPDCGPESGLEGFGVSDKSNIEGHINYEVTTTTFNEVCEKHLSGQTIDYLSVDTEGSEYEILSAIDFVKYPVSVISVEHNFEVEKLEKIKKLLSANNFYEFEPGIFNWDSVFINKNISADQF